MKSCSTILITTIVASFFIQCNTKPKPGTAEHIQEVTAQVDDGRLSRADETPEDWLSHGRNEAEMA